MSFKKHRDREERIRRELNPPKEHLIIAIREVLVIVLPCLLLGWGLSYLLS